MSDTKTILEIDASTGTEVVRELTTQELDTLAQNEAELQALQAEQEAKIAARASALAKLAALGLTEEEIGAL